MQRRILVLTIICFSLITISSAQGHGFGLGVVVGTPTGLSCKAWISHSSALQIEAGWPSLSQTEGTVLSFDYLLHAHIFRSHEQLPLFYGIGGVVGLSSTNAFGLRGVGGLAWWPHGSSTDIFLQVLPTFYFTPSTKFDFDFGLGVRYFF